MFSNSYPIGSARDIDPILLKIAQTKKEFLFMFDNVDELTDKKTGRVGLLDYIRKILENK